MESLKNEIKKLIVDSLGLEDLSPGDIGDDVPLFGDGGIGLDSIDALELGVALRKKYHLSIDSGDSGAREHFASVNNLVKFVQIRGQKTED
ncbi:MAG: phosphopantetheine-binding protein [Candidatus Accumulibacter sp.]|jgi:acyl carrier protein|nr:phosphopantetheine-binding protein [Accumulibacter sp.]